MSMMSPEEFVRVARYYGPPVLDILDKFHYFHKDQIPNVKVGPLGTALLLILHMYVDTEHLDGIIKTLRERIFEIKEDTKIREDTDG